MYVLSVIFQRAAKLEEDLQRIGSGGKLPSPNQDSLVRKAMAEAVPETVPTSSGKKPEPQIDTSMVSIKQLGIISECYGCERSNQMKRLYIARYTNETLETAVHYSGTSQFLAVL